MRFEVLSPNLPGFLDYYYYFFLFEKISLCALAGTEDKGGVRGQQGSGMHSLISIFCLFVREFGMVDSVLVLGFCWNVDLKIF